MVESKGRLERDYAAGVGDCYFSLRIDVVYLTVCHIVELQYSRLNKLAVIHLKPNEEGNTGNSKYCCDLDMTALFTYS